MVFLLLSPQRVLVQGQNRTPRLYSSGTRSRNRRRVRWHLCWLHRLDPGTSLVQARTYSDLRELHFSNKLQSCAAFRHWFSPSSCIKVEAGQVKKSQIRQTQNTHYNLYVVAKLKDERRHSNPPSASVAVLQITLMLTVKLQRSETIIPTGALTERTLVELL